MDIRRTFLRIAAVCAVVGPIILLSSDIAQIVGLIDFGWTLGLWAAMMLMIPAVIGLTYLLAKQGSRLAVVAGCFAYFGLVAGASMQVLFRVHAVLREQDNLQTVEQLRQTFKLVASTQMIGLAWPIGLLLFAIVTFQQKFPVWLPLTFVVAAISFPIGRIAFSQPAVVLSGVCFIVIFFTVSGHLRRLASEG